MLVVLGVANPCEAVATDLHNNLTHLTKQFLFVHGANQRLVASVERLKRPVKPAQRHLGPLTLANILLQLRRALCNGQNELGLPRPHLLDAKPVHPNRHQAPQQSAQGIEPVSLVEVRLQNEPRRGASLVPHAIVIRSRNPETVFTRRKVIIIGNAARTPINPIAIVALQLVLELHAGGNQQAQTGVVKLNLVFAGG